MTLWLLALGLSAYAFLFWLLGWHRAWNRRAYVKRRLLVREGEQPVWRVIRGRVLVGWPSTGGSISGDYAPREGAKEAPYSEEWIVIQTSRRKLIVYRVTGKVDDQKIGTIEIYSSWPVFQAAVPAKIYEEAARKAGIIKPQKYRELKLEA